MSHPFYREYVADEKFMDGYRDYQQRYAETMRENDKILVSLVRNTVDPLLASDAKPRLLDVGCSTGNLLLHLKRLVPGVELSGCDLAAKIVDGCRDTPDLSGVEFKVADAVSLPWQNSFDVITINAVLYLFADEEYRRVLASVHAALRPGGTLIAFDFFHRWEQELIIHEKSMTHPNGLVLHFRPYSNVAPMLRAVGFESETFTPYTLPIDLDQPTDWTDMRTYTVPTTEGLRLPFRGSLFQPWAFLVARKSDC